MKRISGTKEWSVESVNFIRGCQSACRYCFARHREVVRFKRIKEEDWPNMVLREKEVTKKRKKVNGRIMIPTSHDIFPDFIRPAITVLENLLKAGNEVLIVTKPSYYCVSLLCDHLEDYKDKILFRFTIGCMQDSILKYWEPGAPSFPERMKSLIAAFKLGFKTSVSSEPLLDTTHLWQFGELILPYITDAWWIGKMNHIATRVKIETAEDRERVGNIRFQKRGEEIFRIYNMFKDNPKVKWKESIKDVVGLSRVSKAGEDV